MSLRSTGGYNLLCYQHTWYVISRETGRTLHGGSAVERQTGRREQFTAYQVSCWQPIHHYGYRQY